MKKETIAVLAGSYEQFNHFLETNNYNKEDFTYIRSKMDVIGKRFNDVLVYGTWYENPSCNYLKDLAKQNVI